VLEQPVSFAFSPEVLGEYDAANADIDRLLGQMDVGPVTSE